MGRVQDRVAVITGAANGLGQAMARRLAEEGARVVLGDLDASGLERTAASITAAGGVALPVVGDLTEEAPAAQLINAVVPGPIETERVSAHLHRLNETVEYSPNRMTPLHRLGQPLEVANAVLFLASDEASYITGHTLAVTGGR